jgi:formylglycine-generating enzyme required for sulfatase activity
MAMKTIKWLLITVLALVESGAATADDVMKPYSFQQGKVIHAHEVNENFDILYQKINELYHILEQRSAQLETQNTLIEQLRHAIEQGRPATPQAGDLYREPVTGMVLVHMPGGCFDMGDNAGEPEEQPVHRVCIQGGWMGKYEVTQQEWLKVMGANPSQFAQNGDRHPVEKVSWADTRLFLDKLNTLGKAEFRLPTEAEWEYACRSGGKKEVYSGGGDPRAVAWVDENWKDGHHPVGGKAANGLGLHDMSGNLWEWVADNYDPNAYRTQHTQDDPHVMNEDTTHVVRGGSWSFSAKNARCTKRRKDTLHEKDGYLGFRIFMSERPNQ